MSNHNEEWAVQNILESRLGVTRGDDWPMMSMMADNVRWANAEPDVGIMEPYPDDCETSFNIGNVKTSDWNKAVDLISHVTGIQTDRVNAALSATVYGWLEDLEPE